MKPTEKTRVEFYYHDQNEDLYALFPDTNEGAGHKLCYSHIGQHSACSVQYVMESRPAEPEEFKPLAVELISIGYKLQIIKQKTPIEL